MVNGLCVWCLEHSARCRKCSRCRGPWYCSPDCQLSHWEAGHREECWGTQFVHACVQLPRELRARVLDYAVGLQRGKWVEGVKGAAQGEILGRQARRGWAWGARDPGQPPGFDLSASLAKNFLWCWRSTGQREVQREHLGTILFPDASGCIPTIPLEKDMH